MKRTFIYTIQSLFITFVFVTAGYVANAKKAQPARSKGATKKAKKTKKVVKLNKAKLAAFQKKWPHMRVVKSAKILAALSKNKPKSGMQLVGPFLMDYTEVTAKEYQDCVKANRCSLPPTKGKYCTYGKSGKGNHPINCVTWHQARQYCRWKGKRLPTTLEWKWAARGPNMSSYPWGNQHPNCQLAVFRGYNQQAGCDRDSTWPVASKSSGNSYFDVSDMAGNVKEWSSDCAKRNNRGQCTHRNILGGSWQSTPPSIAIDAVSHAKSSTASPLTGFRCTADLPEDLFLVEEVIEEEVVITPAPTATPYTLTIPKLLISPCDGQCKNWDSIGGLRQQTLLRYRKNFLKETANQPNQYCWKTSDNKWRCQQQTKGLFVVLAFFSKVIGLYNQIHEFAQNRGYYRPDPQLKITIHGKTYTFKKRSDTFSPSWNTGKRIPIALGDRVKVELYDIDAFFQKALISKFSFTFTPPTKAQKAGVFRYIHNSEKYAKAITFDFAR